jgi:hypothetical protein
MPTRREMLQALTASLGAGAAIPGLTVPGLAADHPLAHPATAALPLDQADARSQAADYKPEFLDAHHLDTLRALAERIVPGSTAVKVAEFTDQVLAVNPPEEQRRFLTALGAFEGQAVTRFQRPWTQLSEADQVAILTDASTMAPGRPTRWGERGRPVAGQGERVVLTLRDHFDLLKGWISGAYYSTETGMRELGWTGNMFHRAYPGCEHPGSHA